MKNKIIIIFCTLIVFVFALNVLRYQKNKDYQKRGSLLIDKIETFRQLEKRLPNDVKELGLEEPMNDGPYYERKNSVTYVVFFNIGFDNTIIYYSNKKEWIYEP
ncbi:MAG: hypothetical protein EOL95_08230 [Bacteroidia bacterium]|nr:hypothetical protein [Bacteroidia bacterium]